MDLQQIHRQQELEKLFEENNDYLYGFACSQTCDTGLAEEILQQSWYKVIKNFGQFDNRSAFRTWACSIIRNELLETIRKRQVSARHGNGESLPKSWDLPTEPNQTSLNDRMFISFLLRNLTQRDREIVVLKHYIGFSHEEIHRITGFTVPAIKAALRKALVRVRADARKIGREALAKKMAQRH